MHGSKNFLLLILLSFLGTRPIIGAKVIKVGASKTMVAISFEQDNEFKIGQTVCVRGKNREKFCGRVVKVKTKGAICLMDSPVTDVVPGDKVQAKETTLKTDIPSKKSEFQSSPSMSPTPVKTKKTFPFLAASFMNWQHQAKITNGTESVNFNGNSLGLGFGGGLDFKLGLLSLVTQGQILFGNAEIGFLKGAVPNSDIDISGQGLGYFGVRLDASLLMNLNEGVCWGIGIPLTSTFFFKQDLGSGFQLKTQDFIQWGFFLDFRLRRNSSVINPKMGFARNLRQYFISIDYQWYL